MVWRKNSPRSDEFRLLAEEFSRRFSSPDEKAITRFLVSDPNSGVSIFNALKMARENARTTREIIPSEAWEQINDLYLQTRESVSPAMGRGKRHQQLNRVRFCDKWASELAHQQPAWPPGEGIGESALFYGHLLGQVVQSVDGRSLGSFRQRASTRWMSGRWTCSSFSTRHGANGSQGCGNAWIWDRT